MSNKNIEDMPKITIPLNIIYYCCGLDEEFVLSLNNLFNPYIGDLSRHIDISNLEAITFTCEDYYEEAINKIDRGFVIKNRIIPRKGGAGMTLPLKRGNDIKCHVVFNVNKWTYELNKDGKNSLTNHAMSIIAHEMVHVEIISCLHKHSPNICFPKLFRSLREKKGFEISKLSIEEFIACKKSHLIDVQNITLKNFEYELIQCLNEINEQKRIFINELEDDMNKINFYDAHFSYAKKIYQIFGNLLILSSYYLGSKDDSAEYHIDIENHELFKYIKKLSIILNKDYRSYPDWKNLSFDEIKILLEEMITNEVEINLELV